MDKSITSLWAKPGKSGETIWHPLILHMLDVAASSEAILEREPESTRIRMAECLGMNWAEARPWLLFIIACHDLGKACPVSNASGQMVQRTAFNCLVTRIPGLTTASSARLPCQNFW